jgi:hypothetical protein
LNLIRNITNIRKHKSNPEHFISKDGGYTWSPLAGAEEIDREFTILIDETTGRLYLGKEDGLYLY